MQTYWTKNQQSLTISRSFFGWFCQKAYQPQLDRLFQTSRCQALSNKIGHLSFYKTLSIKFLPLEHRSASMWVSGIFQIWDFGTQFIFPHEPRRFKISYQRVQRISGHQDYVAPNTFFFVSSRVRNPSATPSSNYWYFYVQQPNCKRCGKKNSQYLDQTHFELWALNTSAALRQVCSVVFGILVAAIGSILFANSRTQFQEHIDLRKFFPGFVISYRMPFFQAIWTVQPQFGWWPPIAFCCGFRDWQVYPNTLPWNFGTANDISLPWPHVALFS